MGDASGTASAPPATQQREPASEAALPLDRGWQLAILTPAPRESHAAQDPDQLARLHPSWLAAQAPGTALGALRSLGLWSLEAPPSAASSPGSLDANEIWYRLRFPLPAASAGHATKWLRFDGLATLADVWLNGVHLLHSENMFLHHRVEVGSSLREENELLIRFASLERALAAKRPRPRWKTRLVEQQQLRWFRTTLLGRIPGWTPRAPAVGPWKGIFLEQGRARPAIELRPSLDGKDGVMRATVRFPSSEPGLRSAFLEVATTRAPLTRVSTAADAAGDHGAPVMEGEVRIPDAPLWWPHTHGPQPRHPVRIVLERRGEAAEIIECGSTGFRQLELERANGAFRLRINRAPIFCRGACWTTLDIVTLHGERSGYRAALEQARDAGMNMLRVGGTMAYEDAAFYELCDELGILVFQDFQFANFDYPSGDEGFVASVRAEATQFLERTQLSPALAILCGGSEVEQQAAMFGAPSNLWASPLSTALLPSICAYVRPDVPYVQNSPTGGPLPFTVSEGLSHYYGVGAYLRPLEDARRAEVRFTSECLAFANVPEQASVDALLGEGQRAPHHPRWKERVPRDGGAGWDFDDVRDHYLQLLFAVDPVALRSCHPERYMQLSRAVSGEVMAATLAEWRRGRSSCRGALIWFLRDLWNGAGFGLIDARGLPKPAYWYVKRALQPLALVLSDEGNNGLRLHAINESAAPFAGEVRLALYRDGEQRIAEGAQALEIPARGEVELWGDALLGRFTDSTFAYRFGPPGHDLAVASLRDASGALLRQAFHFPLGRPSRREQELGLEARLDRAGSGWAVIARSRRFAQAVALEVDGAQPEESWFHLEPGVERRIALAGAGETPPRVLLEALNGMAPVRAAWDDAVAAALPSAATRS